MTSLTEREAYSAWWKSPDVRDARLRSNYDETGDLTAVLKELLVLLDAREIEKSHLPFTESSKVLKTCAMEFIREDRVYNPPRGSIIQMLDIGADPERLRKVFLPEDVDRELERWRPWRLEVLNLARRGATGLEIREVCPPGVDWIMLRELLSLHGFDYPAEPPATPTQVAAAALRIRVMTEYQKGGTQAAVAGRAGCTPAYVKALLYGIRHGDGLYAGLDHFLVRAA